MVAILSRKRSLYSTRRMVEAIRARGHRPLVLDTLRCNLVLTSGSPRMVFRGVELRGLDVVIPRIGASITSYGLAVVEQLETMGVPALNGAQAIARSRDKLRCLQLLARSGLRIPRTVMARDASNVPRLVDEVGGLPAVVKLLRGTQGVGVMLASTIPELQGILDTFQGLGQEIVLQEFVAESRGRDIRALVVGGRVVGAMRRRAKRGEFRSNLHRGGRGRPVELAPAYVEAAVQATRGGGPGGGGRGFARDQRRTNPAGGELQPGIRGSGASNRAGRRGRHHRPCAGPGPCSGCRDAASALRRQASSRAWCAAHRVRSAPTSILSGQPGCFAAGRDRHRCRPAPAFSKVRLSATNA